MWFWFLKNIIYNTHKPIARSKEGERERDRDREREKERESALRFIVVPVSRRSSPSFDFHIYECCAYITIKAIIESCFSSAKRRLDFNNKTILLNVIYVGATVLSALKSRQSFD